MTDAAAAYTAQFVLASLPPGARRVLEVGCGAGEVAQLLAEAGLLVVAVDSETEAVGRAQARGVDARLATWPVPVGGRFDAVLFARSLHHMPRLEESVAAAFGCLGESGRIIVEDFAYDEAPEPTLRWFRSVARIAAAAGGPVRAEASLGGLLDSRASVATWWQREHDHDLHAAPAIEASLRRHAGAVHGASAAYYFRYLAALLPAASALQAAFLDHELEMIALGLIDPLGRRFIASRD